MYSSTTNPRMCIHAIFSNLLIPCAFLGFWPFYFDHNGHLQCSPWRSWNTAAVICQNVVTIVCAVYSGSQIVSHYWIHPTLAGVFMISVVGGGFSTSALRILLTAARQEIRTFWNRISCHYELILGTSGATSHAVKHQLDKMKRDLLLMLVIVSTFGLPIVLGIPFEELRHLASTRAWFKFAVKSFTYVAVTTEPLCHTIFYVLVYGILRWICLCYLVIVDEAQRIVDSVQEVVQQLEFRSNDPVKKELRDLEVTLNALMTNMREMNCVVDQFNLIFKNQLLLGLFILGMPILMTLYVFYASLISSGAHVGTFSLVGGCLMHITILLCLCSAGTEITECAHNVCKQMEKLPLEVLTSVTQLKMQLFFNRMTNRRVEISPANYVTFNNRLIASLLSVIATYFIVLIQFNGADKMNQGRSQSA